MGNIAHYYALTFAASDLPNTQETTLAALYNQYRIDRITVRFLPLVTNNTAGDWMANPLDAAVTHQSLTSVAICYDDAVAPANEAEVLEYENVTLHPTMGQPWEVSFVPRMKLDTNTVNSVPMSGVWLDTGNLGVTHFGIKVCVPTIAGDVESVEGIFLYARYDISFRQIH